MATEAVEVIQLARDTMLGFDAAFLPSETELLRKLLREERTLLEEFVLLDNMAFELPTDTETTVDVSVFAVSYAKPATLWRLRQATLVYSAGKSRTIRTVPANWRHSTPQQFPSMYFKGADFFPLDNGAVRRYGWDLAQDVVLDYITEPIAFATEEQELTAPDEAATYLGHVLAYFMAVRAKVASQSLTEIKEMKDTEHQRLLLLAGAQPGAESYPSSAEVA